MEDDRQMTTVRHSITRGRPQGASRAHTVTWAAWWKSAPSEAPRHPDAGGGAPSSDAVLELVRTWRGNHDGDTFVKVEARWAKEWRAHLEGYESCAARKVAKAEAKQRAQEDAQRFHEEFESRRAQARADYERNPAAFDEWLRSKAKEWTDFRDGTLSPAAPIAPACVAALGLTWPTFSADDVRRAYRAKAFEAHPDRGGSHDAFVALGSARDQALRYAVTHGA